MVYLKRKRAGSSEPAPIHNIIILKMYHMTKENRVFITQVRYEYSIWLRGWDLNLTTSGLWARRATNCSTPRYELFSTYMLTLFSGFVKGEYGRILALVPICWFFAKSPSLPLCISALFDIFQSFYILRTSGYLRIPIPFCPLCSDFILFAVFRIA